MLSTIQNNALRNTPSLQKSQQISTLESFSPLKFGEKKNEQQATEAKVKATWGERFNYANDHVLLRESCMDLIVTGIGTACEYFKPLKAVFGPVLMVRWAILFTTGLFTSSKKIKEHFKNYPLETREVRWIAPFLGERIKPIPPIK